MLPHYGDSVLSILFILNVAPMRDADMRSIDILPANQHAHKHLNQPWMAVHALKYTCTPTHAHTCGTLTL